MFQIRVCLGNCNYLSVFSPHAEKCGPEELGIRTIFIFIYFYLLKFIFCWRFCCFTASNSYIILRIICSSKSTIHKWNSKSKNQKYKLNLKSINLTLKIINRYTKKTLLNLYDWRKTNTTNVLLAKSAWTTLWYPLFTQCILMHMEALLRHIQAYSGIFCILCNPFIFTTWPNSKPRHIYNQSIFKTLWNFDWAYSEPCHKRNSLFRHHSVIFRHTQNFV